MRKKGSWVLVLGVGLAASTTACGGESEKDGESGGSGGSGAGAGAGGKASVGLSLTLGPLDAQRVTIGSRRCHAGASSGFTYVIGEPTASGTIEGGTNGVEFECAVNGDGTFSATGSGKDGNGMKPISFTFSGNVSDKQNPVQNPGTMTFFSPDTALLTTLEDFPGCAFGPVATFKPGAILTEMECPLIGSPDDVTSGCSVRGTLAFEYCKTGDVAR